MNLRYVLILVLALIASGCASTSNPDQQLNQEQSDEEESSPPQPPTPDQQSDTDDTSQEETSTSDNTVRLTNDGFQPSTMTVEQGETVTWINEGSTAMWIGSDRHPTHTQHDGTSVSEHCENGESTGAFDQCSTGEEFSFTFEKTGEWDYHNHRLSSQTGTVVVE